MPVESRQGPIYFHAVQNKKYRSNYDDIFRKKDKKPKKTVASKPPEPEAQPTPDNTQVDNT